MPLLLYILVSEVILINAAVLVLLRRAIGQAKSIPPMELPVVGAPAQIKGIEPEVIEGTEAQNDAVYCGCCDREVKSSPVGSHITENQVLVIYKCEHCDRKISLPA